jgi:polyhydroxyalkanoate synthesis regulator phasin
MSRLEDLRRTAEAAIETLSPARARELAKSLLEPGAAKEQVTKVAGELIEWSQRNRERLTELVRTEIADQLRRSGVATRAEVDALQRRVRALEKAAAPAKAASSRSTKTAAAKRAKPAASRAASRSTDAEEPRARGRG